jgi:hypothetical protein
MWNNLSYQIMWSPFTFYLDNMNCCVYSGIAKCRGEGHGLMCKCDIQMDNFGLFWHVSVTRGCCDVLFATLCEPFTADDSGG